MSDRRTSFDWRDSDMQKHKVKKPSKKKKARDAARASSSSSTRKKAAPEKEPKVVTMTDGLFGKAEAAAKKRNYRLKNAK